MGIPGYSQMARLIVPMDGKTFQLRGSHGIFYLMWINLIYQFTNMPSLVWWELKIIELVTMETSNFVYQKGSTSYTTLSQKYSHLNIDSFVEKVALRL